MKKNLDFLKRIVQVPEDAKYAGYYHGMIIYDYNKPNSNEKNDDKKELEEER